MNWKTCVTFHLLFILPFAFGPASLGQDVKPSINSGGKLSEDQIKMLPMGAADRVKSSNASGKIVFVSAAGNFFSYIVQGEKESWYLNIDPTKKESDFYIKLILTALEHKNYVYITFDKGNNNYTSVVTLTNY